MKNRSFDIWEIALVVILIFTLLPYLGAASFHTKGEPREAVVAQAMLERGEWILPVTSGADLAYKPPMFHWCVAICSLPFGQVSEFTSRLPSAISLILMSLMFFSFVKEIRGSRFAFFVVLLFASSFEVHRAAMNARVDMLMTFFMVGALLLYYRFYEKGCKGISFGAVAFMTMAFLTKGPVGVLLPCLCSWAFFLFKKENFLKITAKISVMAFLSCIIPFIWYYLAYLQGGGRFIELVLEENLYRFTGKMSYDSHNRPLYYNLVTLFTGWIPWSLLVLVIALIHLPKKKYFKGFFRRLNLWLHTLSAAKIFTLVVIIVIYIFFSIPKSKRSVYLLPIYPFMAIYIYDYLENGFWRNYKVWNIFLRMFLVSGGMLMVICLLVSITGFKIVLPSEFIQMLALHQLSLLGLYSSVPLLIVLILSIRRKDKESDHQIIGVLFALIITLQMFLDGVLLPAMLNVKSTKAFALQVERIVPEGNIYGYISNGGMLRYYVVGFYTHDRVVPFPSDLPQRGYVLCGASMYCDMDTYLEGNYDFTRVIATPHNHTEIKDTIVLYSFICKRKNDSKR